MRLESLLNYYQNELEFLVEGGKTFANEYPTLAKTLDFSSFNSNDPDIQRLIESIAFLNARLQKRLDEQAPEISQQILNAIYPQFLAPIPSISIMQFSFASYANNKLLFLPKKTNLTTKNEYENQTYTFSTTMAIQIAPWEIQDAFLTSTSQTKLPYNIYAICDNAIVITLNQVAQETTDELTFYIHMNDKVAFDVYEAIMSLYPDKNTPVFEDEKEIGEIEVCAMDDESNLFPITANENSAYRILLEYNAFYKKFLFFRIKFKTPPKEKIIIPFNSKKEIFIKKGNLLLNCAPAVNLFEKNSEPIVIDNKNSNYIITCDSKLQSQIDIHTLLSVHDTNDNSKHIFSPYFSCNHIIDGQKPIFWLANKKLNKKQTQYETSISFINDDISVNNRILYAKLLCYQQNASTLIPKEEAWTISDIGNLKCINLDRPTQAQNPVLHSRTQWRLISHLSIDHFGFDNDNTLQYIKELLNIYDFQNLNNKNVNDLKEIGYEIDMAASNRLIIPKANLIIKADDAHSSQSFLLSHIIGTFFSKIMNFNTKLDVILKKNSNDKIWKKRNLI